MYGVPSGLIVAGGFVTVLHLDEHFAASEFVALTLGFSIVAVPAAALLIFFGSVIRNRA